MEAAFHLIDRRLLAAVRIVADGDAERGEMAWAAVCHSGQIVAGLAEPQTPPDDAPLQ